MLRPSHKAIKRYLEDRQKLDVLGVSNEMGLRAPFQQLLAETAREVKWHFVPEQRVHGTSIRPDGVFLTEWKYPLGHWESKDTRDDLEIEINKKRDKGYPFRNIIFEDSKRAVLFQNRVRVLDATLTNPDEVARLLWQFYQHKEENYEDFERAVTQFKADVPELAKSVAAKVHEAYEKDKNYRAAFESFFELCKTSLNPDIRREAVEEMLVQHLLTERLIRTVFDNPEFTKRNVIAAEVEKVIAALVAKSFDRTQFLKHLDRFYIAIEGAARDLHEFRDKQNFLNTVYERFFQGYSVKIADTHGIVYTPQPIVDFMCASVVEVLEQEFGKKLGDKGVNILDPCTGTGNFIVNLMRRIPRRDLPRMYREQLFANEVMLMPYYIAALNIEHAYFDLTGEYEPFEGLCFVDTLDLAAEDIRRQKAHADMFLTRKNTERIERQKRTPITVIIGNPPYNANQQNENDNNKNRKYDVVDNRIRLTYGAASRATNRNMLRDMYIRFFRWASDRLAERDGLVCFVTNNSFVDLVALDGMRKHIPAEFSLVYHVDLHGNVRRNPKLSGTTHNVFGIQVGVGITIAVKTSAGHQQGLLYHRVPEFWRKEDKYEWLRDAQNVHGVQWSKLTPDEYNNWLVVGNPRDFGTLIPLGRRDEKSRGAKGSDIIFSAYSLGVTTDRDNVVYDFDRAKLATRIGEFCESYNAESDRYIRQGRPRKIDDFVRYELVKWSESLKSRLKRGEHVDYDESHTCTVLFRPFTSRYLYFDPFLIDRPRLFASLLPLSRRKGENVLICVSAIGTDKPFHCILSHQIVDKHLTGDTQCFPFYVYNEDGTGRRENITDWALSEFQKRYSPVCHPEDIPMAEGSQLRGSDRTIAAPKKTHSKQRKGAEILQAAKPKSSLQDDKSSGSSFIAHRSSLDKWDIFYYVYGLLHHPGYREKYADNLKRELPRIPFAPDFWAFSDAGKKLAQLHLKYEEIEVPMPGVDCHPEDIPMAEGSQLRGSDRTIPAPKKTHSKQRKGAEILQAAKPKSGLQDDKIGGMRWLVNEDVPLSYHVEKMRLNKEKTQLVVNKSLTLANLPPAVSEYRLGNRSALEWVIDQYQISTDKRSGIKSDPNREDDEEYIVRLIGQVIHVSLETVKIVKSLPAEFE